jgi:hypothetical protein
MIDRNTIKIKTVKFKENTETEIGVKMALTPEKEYELISSKIITQTYSTPACSNVLIYKIKDDNGEINEFPSFVFYKD